MTTGGRREISGTGPESVAKGSDFDVLVGLASIVFPIIYFVADLIETAQGNFSTGRLVLAYIGESAIPFFVLGLYATQRPRIGRLGLFGALAYGYSFVFFTSTVVYALAADLSKLEGGHPRLRRLVHPARRHHGDRWGGLRTRLH